MKTNKRFISYVIAAAFITLLSACATQPKINTASFSRPKTVALVDVPPLMYRPRIGLWVAQSLHFAPRGETFFDTRRPGAGDGFVTKPITRSSGGVIDGLIMQSIAETEAKSDGFQDEVLKRVPGFDLRNDFMTALRKSLEASGLSVTVLADGRNSQPRLRWPAYGPQGEPYLSESLDSSPPVDADILVQVSPISFYNAPGALNPYRPNVSVGLALYEGRTRKFIGFEIFKFSSNDGNLNYMKYDTMIEEIPKVTSTLRSALLSLVPRIADVVNGRPVQ